jgi:hypothetical protein
MASVLIANVLTVTFVYCFAKIHQKECIGKEEGRLISMANHSRFLVHALWALHLGRLALRTGIISPFNN